MEHLQQWKDGLIPLEEMARKELHDAEYDNHWVKDVFSNDSSISDMHLNMMCREVDNFMAERSMQKVLGKRR